MRQQNILSYIVPQLEKMDKFENEMSDPQKHLPKQKFREKTKFSFIMCNEKYDPDYVTHKDLPEVVNDYMNTKQTVNAMGIPPENVVSLRDASYEQLRLEWRKFRDKIYVFSRVLNEKTGVLGLQKHTL